MFTIMMLRPPMPQLADLLEMLHSFETTFLEPNARTATASQVAFISQKNARKSPNEYSQKKKEFSSQNRGFQPAVKKHIKTDKEKNFC